MNKLPFFQHSIFVWIAMLSLLSFQNLNAQTKLQQISKIPFTAQEISCDKFGFIYAINGNALTQYDSNITQQKTYTPKSYGLIRSFDVSDPFKILVFSKEFSVLQMLDNNLSPSINDIHLNTQEIPQPELVCSASENSFWVFDYASFQIYRYNYYLQRINSSGDLRNVISVNSAPIKMLESDSKLFVLFPGTGIVVFDSYGTYMKTIPFEKAVDFQVYSSYIVALINNHFMFYHLSTIEQSEGVLNETSSKKFCVTKNKIYVLSSDSLSIYSVK